MKRKTAIIIDDMPLAIASLKSDLEEFCPDVEVIGEAEGVISGAKLLKKMSPDILFLDIQLKDGEGFDILEMVDNKSQVIFTTASDKYAIKAFQFSAVDYLLKPIDPELLKTAVDKVKIGLELQKDNQYQLLKQSYDSSFTNEKIALHTQEKIQIAEIEKIIRCEADGNYTTFVFKDSSNLLVTKTLKDFEKILSETGFIRVHQSHLINLNHVKEYVKQEGGYLVMTNGDLIPVAVRKKSYVIKVLGNLGK